jgi:hypothetical protein
MAISEGRSLNDSRSFFVQSLDEPAPFDAPHNRGIDNQIGINLLGLRILMRQDFLELP